MIYCIVLLSDQSHHHVTTDAERIALEERGSRCMTGGCLMEDLPPQVPAVVPVPVSVAPVQPGEGPQARERELAEKHHGQRQLF